MTTLIVYLFGSGLAFFLGVGLVFCRPVDSVVYTVGAWARSRLFCPSLTRNLVVVDFRDSAAVWFYIVAAVRNSRAG